jgi:arginase
VNSPATSSAAISLLGIPFDENSSYLRGTAQAPPRIVEALYCDASNLWTENGTELQGKVLDAGSVMLPSGAPEAFAAIQQAVEGHLRQEGLLFLLGGDHSITYPVVKAFAAKFPDLEIMHFDAHPDLYSDLGDNRLSHACPFARIMEEKLARRLVQAGIRTMNRHQREQARRFGVEVLEMKDLARWPKLEFKRPLYLSFDLDVLDPAFAPGISHWEPGGMSVREVVNTLQSLNGRIVGADLVEYNPVRDASGRTAMVCAKVLKEIAALMLAGDRP